MASLDPTRTYIDQIVNDHFNKIDQSKLIETWKPYLDSISEHMASEAAKAMDNAAIEAVYGVEVPEPKNEDLFELKRCIKEAIEKNENQPHIVS